MLSVNRKDYYVLILYNLKKTKLQDNEISNYQIANRKDKIVTENV